MIDDLEELATNYLAVKAEIDALEQAAGAIKEEIEAKVAVRRQSEPETRKWTFEKSAVIYVEPSKRSSLDRALLVQNGVSKEVLDKSTVEKTVKGYAKVEGIK